MSAAAAGASEVPDDPQAVAQAVARLARPLLIGLDVDGTLSHIVRLPHLARLTDGAAAALQALAGTPGVTVGIVSGRSRRDLIEQFGFPPTVELIGSHGQEQPGTGVELTTDERERLGAVNRLAGSAATRAAGAWVEAKPAGVALHTRTAPTDQAAAAREWFASQASKVDGVHVLPGHEVVDVSVRELDKGRALTQLREELGATAVCYVGDDVTDERVFASLDPGDLTVKVGSGPTAAVCRLAGPDEVVTFLESLVRQVAA